MINQKFYDLQNHNVISVHWIFRSFMENHVFFFLKNKMQNSWLILFQMAMLVY